MTNTDHQIQNTNPNKAQEPNNGIVRKDPCKRRLRMEPSVKLYDFRVEIPDTGTESGDSERLLYALKGHHYIKGATINFEVLKTLQASLRKSNWNVTCAVYIGDGQIAPEIIAIWPSHTNQRIFGLAIDIGSTTIAAHVCDLETGLICASDGTLNPQLRFGADLMQRISHAMMHPGSYMEMVHDVRKCLNSLIKMMTTKADIHSTQIMDIVVVGNPVMHHLFLGLDPIELGQAPFTLAVSDAITVMARDVSLDVHSAARVYHLPAIGTHVGGDTAAVILSQAPERAKGFRLTVDIGTHAEIILSDGDRILTTSSPTGPALEGAEITFGQRAAIGAIERVRINNETKELRFKVIGSEYWSDNPNFQIDIAEFGVTGICGSGIIELVAEMRTSGIIDASGRLGSAHETGSNRCFEHNRTRAFHIWSGETDIFVTNGDIRQVQMAKSALYASIRLLMDELDIQAVDQVVLAGAFGSHISAKHAMVLGLIPDCDLTQVSAVGNAAGTGACMALMDANARRNIEATVQTVEKFETATHPDFQEHFVNASGIPNSVDAFPNLASCTHLPKVNFSQRRRRTRDI